MRRRFLCPDHLAMDGDSASTPEFPPGGAPSGASSGGSAATVSGVEEHDAAAAADGSDAWVPSSEVSSTPEGSALDLCLGLSIGAAAAADGSGARGWPCRILTAKDFPSSSASSSASSSSLLMGRINGGFSGSKRAADSAADANSLNCQVVGWPPLRACRMNSLSKQASGPDLELHSIASKGQAKDLSMQNSCNGGDKGSGKPKESGCPESSVFVKVNMDGVPIGRKIDLHAHASYESLAQTLKDMFDRLNETREHGVISRAQRPLDLFDESSGFVLTYEDKDGDWMLAGDVPWRMFLHSVKRLRIMRRCKADGLGTKVPRRG